MSTNAEKWGRLVKYLLNYSFGYAEFWPVVAKIPQTPFLNSEVTETIFICKKAPKINWLP